MNSIAVARLTYEHRAHAQQSCPHENVHGWVWIASIRPEPVAHSYRRNGKWTSRRSLSLIVVLVAMVSIGRHSGAVIHSSHLLFIRSLQNAVIFSREKIMLGTIARGGKTEEQWERNKNKTKKWNSSQHQRMHAPQTAHRNKTIKLCC